MNSLTLNNLARRPGVMLVAVDDQFSLIDPVGEHVLIVNASAAWVWTRIGGNETVSDALAPSVETFLAELSKLDYVSSSYEQTAIEPVAALIGEPRIVASSALQVAANNSAAIADPFA